MGSPKAAVHWLSLCVWAQVTLQAALTNFVHPQLTGGVIKWPCQKGQSIPSNNLNAVRFRQVFTFQHGWCSSSKIENSPWNGNNPVTPVMPFCYNYILVNWCPVLMTKLYFLSILWVNNYSHSILDRKYSKDNQIFFRKCQMMSQITVFISEEASSYIHK